MYLKPSYRFALGLLMMGIAGGLWWGALSDSPNHQPPFEPPEPPALPRISPSNFLNTTSDATYVGSSACIDCHPKQHASFALTPHNQALAVVQEAEEPPDGTFYHTKSGRTYRVYRKEGRLWHREEIRGEEGRDLVLGDYPVEYRIGSGHHSRSYLIDVDEFLFESPITWYAAKNEWGLSPGYDYPVHEGFSRPAHEGCVHCHAGRVESQGGSTHRLQFHEMQIRCESCHGPGSLHVLSRSEHSDHVLGKMDPTIVHPARLSRELSEAICARCHLAAASVAGVRGRHRNDFRPGLPLTDFRVDYASPQSSSSMTVVGHLEQMRQSPCYVKTDNLTCTTCHNPHEEIHPAAKIEHYRQKCHSCHGQENGCGLAENERLMQNSDNDCTACHMPKSGTDIPHFAFTHHRIGLNHQTNYQKPGTSLALVPVGDISQLPVLDQERCQGLGYLHYGDKQTGLKRNVPLQQALHHLSRVHAAGLRDAKVLGGLAYLLWEQDDERCVQYAEQAIHSPDCEPETKINSLIVIGDMQLRKRKLPEAKSAFEQLTKLRLHSVDWQMLGVCRDQERDASGAIAAFQKAISIRADQPELYHLLADAYAKAHQPLLAQQARQQAVRLGRLLPK